MVVNTFSYTGQGGRSNNEDDARYETGENGAGVWCLADGLGGHECGEVAAKLAVDYVIAEAKKIISRLSEPALLDILRGANRLVLERQSADESRKTMRTTVVAAFSDGEWFRAMNAGDSRFYYFKNGCLYAQSKDHTVSQIAVNMGEITETQIRFHDDRNKLLKVLGNEPDLKIDQLYEPIRMEQGDAFLLCSDGFWEAVYETEMEIDLVKSATPEEWLRHMLKRLLARITDNHDNFTAVGVFVE